ncbi:ABC transporter permease [bacterium]|nr:ABC transporter permease [bacterium]
MISALLIRRFWIIKNRLFTTLGLLLILPIFLNVVINLPFKRLVVNPLWNIPHEQWIYPGLTIIAVIMMMIPSVYRDLFDLRIHKKLLPSLALTPMSKSLYLYYFLITVLIETIVYTALVMAVYSVLIAPGFSLLDYLIMFPFFILFIALSANILITLSLVVDKTTLYNLLMLIFFLFIVFASGTVIEFEYFPEIIGNIFRYLPTGQIMQSLRMAMFSGVVNWLIFFSALVTIILWTYLNGLLFKKRLTK